MTWSQLQTFTAVADTGSVQTAAIRLSVTESAVSASLAGLQKSLGFALVERVGRGIQLTPSGEVYAGYARRILGLLDEARSTAAAQSTPEAGTVRLGAVTTAGEYLLPGLLASFHRAYPRVALTLHIGCRDRVHELLITHQLDLVIGGRPPAGQQLRSRAQRPNCLIAVAAPNARADPAATTWLLREEGSGTRDTTLQLLAAQSLTPPTLTLGSPGAVVSAAELGLGIGLVAREAVARQLTDGSLIVVPVPGTPLTRPWHVVTPAFVNATTNLFLRHITNSDRAGAWAFTRSERSTPPSSATRDPVRQLPSPTLTGGLKPP